MSTGVMAIINARRWNEWLEKMSTAMDHDLLYEPKYERTVTRNDQAQAIVYRLTSIGRAFRVIQLGAGVKMITTDVSVCPKCHGTGKC